MSKCNADSNSADFEKTYLETNPEGNVQRKDTGGYYDDTTTMYWAAYKKAYHQYATTFLNKRKQVIEIKSTPNNESFMMKNFIIGSSMSGEFLRMSVKPRVHQNFDVAKTEAERMNEQYPNRSFFVFGCIHKVKGKLEKLLAKDPVAPITPVVLVERTNNAIPAGTHCLFTTTQNKELMAGIVAEHRTVNDHSVKVWCPKIDELFIIPRDQISFTITDPSVFEDVKFQVIPRGTKLIYKIRYPDWTGSSEFIVKRDVINKSDYVSGIFADGCTTVNIEMYRLSIKENEEETTENQTTSTSV